MSEMGGMALIAFAAVSSLSLLVLMLAGGRSNRLERRLRTIAHGDGPGAAAAAEVPPDPVAEFVRTTIPKMGAVLVPDKEEERTKLQTRLVHAGYYSRQAMVFFLGIKLLLIIGPALVGLVIGALGIVDIKVAVVVGAMFGVFGMIGPSFWLDMRKSARQLHFRRALPDALDVLVICLEGGASLPSAVRRVAMELRTAHPVLADELNLVQREIQLGRTPGEALREFASRTDLEEVRSLAAVILQSEKFGASLVKSLRVHAEAFRSKRIMEAEELAQKAVVKLLFPTVLFILPALFIAVLGPAGIQIMELFKELGQ
jgi:tight adherence protein C